MLTSKDLLPGSEEPGNNDHGGVVADLSKRVPAPACLAIVVAAILSLYISVMSPNSFGYGNDDAIYLTSAKALATGQGYRQISLPYQPSQTRYPPGYPLLLSLVWRAFPNFPTNLTAIMLLSLLASAVAMILAWVYLSKFGYASRWSALVIVGLAAVNAHTVICSTTVIPEMPYTSLSIAALILAEAHQSDTNSWIGGWRGGTLLGVLMGLAALTRMAGITLPLAVLIFYLGSGARRKAILPLTVAALFVVSWVAWTHLNRSTYDEANAIYFTDYFRHSYELVKNARTAAGGSLLGAAWELAGHNLIAMAYTTPLEVIGYNYDWFGGPIAPVATSATVLAVIGLVVMILGIKDRRGRRWRLMPIYALLSLLLIVLLPFPDNSYERYLVPVLPMFVCFLIQGLWRLGTTLERILISTVAHMKGIAASVAVMPAAAVAAVCLLSYSHSIYWTLHDLKDAFDKSLSQDVPAMIWINENTAPGNVLACVRHARYYLYTGRRSALCFPTTRPPGDQIDNHPDMASESILRILRQNGADYVVLTAWDLTSHPGGVDFTAVLKQLSDLGVLSQVFQSPDGRSAIFRVLSAR